MYFLKKLVQLNKSYTEDFLDMIFRTRVLEPLQKGISRPPYFINIHLANRGCSHDCVFCIDNGEKVEEVLIKDRQQFMNILQKLVDIQSADGYRIEEFHFDGDSSDPMLNKTMDTLVEGIRFLKANGRKINIITNGVHLLSPKFLEVAYLVDDINVSLNATNAYEHELQSRRKTWGRVLDGIKAVNAKRKVKDSNTVITLSHVVTKLKDDAGREFINLTDLDSLINTARNIGADRSCFRIDFNINDPDFIKTVTEKIERYIQQNIFPMTLKRETDKKYFSDCVAPLVWQTITPNGMFDQYCAHNIKQELLTLDPFKINPHLAVLCGNKCPSYIALLNERYHNAKKLYSGFGPGWSDLMHLLNPSAKGFSLSAGGLYIPDNYLHDNYALNMFGELNTAQSLGFNLTQPIQNQGYNNLGILVRDNNKDLFGFLNKNYLYNTNLEIIGERKTVPFAKKQQFGSFVNSLEDNPVNNIIAYANEQGEIIARIVEFSKEIVFHGKKGNRFLFDERNEPVAAVNEQENLYVRIDPDKQVKQAVKIPALEIILEKARMVTAENNQAELPITAEFVDTLNYILQETALTFNPFYLYNEFASYYRDSQFLALGINEDMLPASTPKKNRKKILGDRNSAKVITMKDFKSTDLNYIYYLKQHDSRLAYLQNQPENDKQFKLIGNYLNGVDVHTVGYILRFYEFLAREIVGRKELPSRIEVLTGLQKLFADMKAKSQSLDSETRSREYEETDISKYFREYYFSPDRETVQN